MLLFQRLPGHPPLTSLRSFAPPYALRRGRSLCPLFSRHSERCTMSFRAERGNSVFNHPFVPQVPPSHSVRGARGDALAGVSQATCVEFPAGGLSPCGASPAHIASLVRAPLRFAKGAYALPLAPLSFRAERGISVCNHAFVPRIPPFAQRKGG